MITAKTSGVYTVSGLPTKSELTVFNIKGEELCSSNPNETSSTIDLSDSPKGIYFLKIVSDKDIIGIRKVITN